MADVSKSSSGALVFGLSLVITGTILLLTRLDIVDISWFKLYPLFAMVLGLVLFLLCVVRREKGNVFPAVFFVSLGVYFFLRNYGFIEFFHFDRIWPVFFVALGLSFLALFVVTPRDWGVMVPGSLFLFFGITMLIRNLGDYWYWYELAANYWALIIVAIGVSILISSLLRKSDKSS